MADSRRYSPSDPKVTVHPDGKVFLLLSPELYRGKRMLGRIVEDTFHCERDPERHLMRTINSYGFNYHLMRLPLFEKVIVHQVGGEDLFTTRQHILERGSILHFKKPGFELQIFLPLKHFGPIETTQNCAAPRQLSLFDRTVQ